MTSAPFSAQGTPQGQGGAPMPVVAQLGTGPMAPARTGLGPQPPALTPIAVSQIEEGRRSDEMEQTISLSFAEPVAIRELLLLLVRDTNISVVPDSDIDGTFTGELKNVTLRQALDLILRPQGLDSTFHENVLRVSRKQIETRIFHINYVSTRRSGQRGTSSNGTGSNYSGNSNGAGVGGFGGYTGAAATGSGGSFGGGQASVSGSDDGDVFEELTTGLQTLLSEAGRFNMDRKAGLLQVSDYSSNLDRIGSYVEAYENRALRQVLIVAKIIEVELREEFSAGIDWNVILRSAGNAVTLTQRLAPTRNSSAFTMGVNIKDFTGLLEAFASQGTDQRDGEPPRDGDEQRARRHARGHPGCLLRDDVADRRHHGADTPDGGDAADDHRGRRPERHAPDQRGRHHPHEHLADHHPADRDGDVAPRRPGADRQRARDGHPGPGARRARRSSSRV